MEKKEEHEYASGASEKSFEVRPSTVHLQFSSVRKT